MADNKEGKFNRNLFIQGFTGKKFTDGQKGGRKKPLTAKEAAERRRRLNAKYDQFGNLR